MAPTGEQGRGHMLIGARGPAFQANDDAERWVTPENVIRE